MSGQNYKICGNCKYRKTDLTLSDYRCTEVSNMSIDTNNGIVSKSYPKITIVGFASYNNKSCPVFKPTRKFSIQLAISNIKLKWFKHRYPEKFI
jgi:hypothetical protein